ncbi:MAG: lysoplasmalogenase [Novosphingobium sp.]|nr:lysoplasmalogenase [Novosphingobium sp.]
MPKRALVEKRPWLLASLAAAIAYYALKDADFPGTYLLLIEVGALLLLAVYALLRGSGGDARMLAGAMAAAGLGVVAVELDPYIGGLLLIVGNGLFTGLFLRHRRETLQGSQKVAAVALLALVPLICWGLPLDRDVASLTAVYGLSLGGMAGTAWTSTFSRYRVGIGALVCVGAGILGIAGQGVLVGNNLPQLLSWPLFYLGHFLVCIGVTQVPRSPESR